MIDNKALFSLYLVTDHRLSLGRSTEEVVLHALKGGVKTVQLRNKDCSTRDLLLLGEKLKKLTAQFDVPLIINDRVDLTLALDCDGVHLGQSDLPLQIARKILGAEKIIGISVETLEQALEAEKNGATYCAVNGVFYTDTKSDIGPPLGLEFVQLLKKAVAIPIIGIGGIKIDNAAKVIAAGCDGIAVVSGITMSENIELTCANYLAEIQIGRNKQQI